ncbi:MAG: DEAD/DEAH box helicase [Candidatus Contendobacter sp.]|nr:MAG: DEAD/DEAH box helicase [Candidatus Contendobacter sp.]
MLHLKPSHKAIRAYYQEIETLSATGAQHEGALAPAFAALLRHCAGQLPNLKLVEQYPIRREGRRPLRVDGAILDSYELRLGVWEAKDSQDDLAREIQRKFAEGYPRDNILFQSPDRLVLYQNGRETFNADIRRSPEALIDGLRAFFGHRPPAFAQWHEAVEGFKEKVEELGQALLRIIERERGRNVEFAAVFAGFLRLCRESINPRLAESAVEEMLIQHLLTERIFRKVFDNPDFVSKNIIAREIEKVIAALTARSFSREEFLRKLDHYYRAIESTAATIDDYAEKQTFLNAVYERFFQGFAVKVADTHGIVYTPQPIVDFMVRSVDEILRREFERSLSAPGVHVLDPFVGTGNFIVRVLRQIDLLALPQKYAGELHCNEIMLLPYYIASMNIEHAYYEIVGEYRPFEGICLVDTFELAEGRQHQFGFLTQANTERVMRQKEAPIFVIIGNPPYNAGQVNENDNNKNRKYPVVDRWVAETYAVESKATNKNALSDPYVKAFAWATQRLKDQHQGVIALVTNNGFLEGIAFDGMRKCLAKEFAAIYLLDLGGNVRKNPKLSGTTHNVFGIQVGVSIALLIKKPVESRKAKIYYARVGEGWRKEAKYDFLNQQKAYQNIEWREVDPDLHQTWLTEGLQSEFHNFIPMGGKEEKSAKSVVEGVIFKIFSNGIKTNRDVWTYNFNRDALAANVQRTIEFYNEQVFKWNRLKDKPKVDDFVGYDDARISWSESLKNSLQHNILAQFDPDKVRVSLYRPFSKLSLYFDRIFNERVYLFPLIYPRSIQENENKTICISGVGSNKPFHVLMTNIIPCLDSLEKTQCFPFYAYTEDGQNRRENITDWALIHFCHHYRDSAIGKWDIFHYAYGLLHHSDYRRKYAANLRRELPRIPLVPDFWAFARAGQALAELHVHYEQQPAYPLKIQATAQPLRWDVQKMKLNKEKTALIYNETLTLAGIPPGAFDYRLGNRSALDWIIDQYQTKTDPRSGIVNDPHRPDEPRYIIELIQKVIYVSVETVRIIEALPRLAD